MRLDLKNSLSLTWCVTLQFPELELIDRKTFGHQRYWSVNMWKYVKDLKGIVILVAEIDNIICGYVVYKLYSHKLDIIRIAVDYQYRNNGIGQAIISRLREKLTKNRKLIEVSAPEEPASWFVNVCDFEIGSYNSLYSVHNLYLERNVVE